MGPMSSRRKRPKWYRPSLKEDKDVQRMTLLVFAVVLGAQLLLLRGALRNEARHIMGSLICDQIFFTTMTVSLAWSYLLFRGAERRNAESYTYYWKGRFDDIVAKVRQALQDQGLDHKEARSRWGRPLHARLFSFDILVIEVPDAGFRVYMENNRKNEDDPADDCCTVHVGPVSDETHAAIFHFIEAFNDLFDEEELPKLVVWGRRTGRPERAANTGREDTADER